MEREEIIAYAGFRPLAGFWFLNYIINDGTPIFRDGFPSPCGVLVLKWKTMNKLENLFRFPSPCGVLVLK